MNWENQDGERVYLPVFFWFVAALFMPITGICAGLWQKSLVQGILASLAFFFGLMLLFFIWGRILDFIPKPKDK